jgi:RNA polymerase sigma factor (sigma-70 family)
MAGGRHRTLRHLEQVLSPVGGDLADGHLLERFVAARDEASFAALVRRHGPMVLGVCRRVLGHLQDAEDAFQATFLVLARKAAAVRRGAVASYLYAVAYRTALEARAVNARRRARERQVEAVPHPAVGPPEPQDWRPLLDRELARLPRKYRQLIVLCDLEGRARKEVARQLGLPEGTLSSRLAAARRLLARRLTRAGIALPAGVLAAALADGASAAVPMPLLLSTVGAAVLVAAGQGAGALTPAADLMRRVLQAMFLKKLKVAALAVLVVLAALGAGEQVRRSAGTADPPAPSLEQMLDRLAQVRKQRADLDRQEEQVLEGLRARAQALAEAERRLREGGAAAPAADRWVVVASPCEGQLVFLGTEIKPGEPEPPGKSLAASLAFLAVQAEAGEAGAFTLPGNSMVFRPWRDTDQPEAGKAVAARRPVRARKLQVGDRVKEGQLLALVNLDLAFTDLAAHLARLEAGAAEHRAAVTTKHAIRERYNAMLEANRHIPGSVGRDELVKAKLEWEKAVGDERVKEAAVRLAQAELNKAATVLRGHEIRSPSDGVVSRIEKKPGEWVRAGEGVLQLREP